jgi:hypothetical protein
MARALHTGVLCLLVLLAGCSAALGIADDPAYEYEVYNHGDPEGDPFISDGVSWGERGDYAVLITNESGTERFNLTPSQGEATEYNEEASEFVRETNFPSEYLVVYQQYPTGPSQKTFVESVARNDDQVIVNLSHPFLEHPDREFQGVGLTVIETVLIRIDTAGRDPPRSGILRYGQLKMNITTSGNTTPCTSGMDGNGDTLCGDG